MNSKNIVITNQIATVKLHVHIC